MKFLLVLLLLVSCVDTVTTVKGPDGDEGEQGVEGTQGIQGIQGESGEKGDNSILESSYLSLFEHEECIPIDVPTTQSGYYIKLSSRTSGTSKSFKIYSDSLCDTVESGTLNTPMSFFLGTTNIMLNVFGKGMARSARVIKFNVQ